MNLHTKPLNVIPRTIMKLPLTAPLLISSIISSNSFTSTWGANNNNHGPHSATQSISNVNAMRVCLLPRNRTSSFYSVSTQITGSVNTELFRMYFIESSDQIGCDSTLRRISPWHDIPYKTDKFFNMVVEIPKMTRAKMEISTKELDNPIAQDVKKGKLRDYHGPIYWNYGCIPQTWEDPLELNSDLNVFGDNDPIDVVEIGSKTLKIGSITTIKPLGILAMIDDGELDWKVLAISTDDPLSLNYNDIDDVPLSITNGVREWFRWYKIPDKKPLNKFGFNETFLNAEYAHDIINGTHKSWKRLISGEVDVNNLWYRKRLHK